MVIRKGVKKGGTAVGQYYLAIDIGASSGRHILAHLEQGKMVLEEIYRFENGMIHREGHLCWDLKHLFNEIKQGLKECVRINKIPISMGIDTWAVDYVLLDEKDELIGESYGYRDQRTQGMDEQVYKVIPEKDLYARTGIQKQIFNTIYQLMATKEKYPEHMKQAKTFLMLPDYFHFLLTGNKVSEYTNATSTQLVSPLTKTWDMELIDSLGYNKEMFLPLTMPGAEVGSFTEEIANEIGFTCKVVLPATHDTASAVMSVPSKEDNCVYISSGTWSLMGVENKVAICNEASQKANFTNEGGYDYRFRFLKNIMGLWMIQSVRKETGNAYSFAKLCEMAEENKDFPSRVDVNAPCFLAPEHMTNAIKTYCKETNQQVPETIGEVATVVYQSLAECYAVTVKEIEALTGITYEAIHIVGGGSNAAYLNELTAKAAHRKVLAGPGEATAIGNVVAQMIKEGSFEDLKAARRCIYDSFEIKTFG